MLDLSSLTILHNSLSVTFFWFVFQWLGLVFTSFTLISFLWFSLNIFGSVFNKINRFSRN